MHNRIKLWIKVLNNEVDIGFPVDFKYNFHGEVAITQPVHDSNVDNNARLPKKHETMSRIQLYLFLLLVCDYISYFIGHKFKYGFKKVYLNSKVVLLVYIYYVACC